MLAPNMPASSARAVLSHPHLNMVRRLAITLFLLTLVASSGAGEKKKPGIEWREWSDDIFAQAILRRFISLLSVERMMPRRALFFGPLLDIA